jgi:hypothetical protein
MLSRYEKQQQELRVITALIANVYRYWQATGYHEQRAASDFKRGLV